MPTFDFSAPVKKNNKVNIKLLKKNILLKLEKLKELFLLIKMVLIKF